MTRSGQLSIGLYAMAVAASSGIASPAMADNEYQTLYAYSCNALNCSQDQKSTTTAGQPIGGYVRAGYAEGSVSGYQGGLVNARAGFSPNSVTTGGDFTEDVIATLSYTFKVVGAPNIYVPVHVHGAASITPIQASTEEGGRLILDAMGMPSGYSFFQISSAATVSIGGLGLDVYGNRGRAGASLSFGSMLDASRGNYNIAGKGSFIDRTFYFLSNSDINVDIAALASLRYRGYETGNSIYGSVSAFADPTFSIDDPAFADFNIVGVPTGSPPAAAVPEPATWAMMIAGLGMVGAALRRQRRRLLSAVV